MATKNTSGKTKSSKTTSKSKSTKTTKSKTTSKSKTKVEVKTITSNDYSAKFANLKRWNLGLGLLHAVQALAMALLAKDFRLPLNVDYLTFNESTETLETASRTIADVPLAWLIVAFLAISAVAHGVIAGRWFKNYKRDLEKGINRARWFEYALSASTMMVAIAFLVGVQSLSLMISIFALTAVMNLCGLIMEIHNQTTIKTNWVSYWVGTLAGIIPWLVVGLYFLSNYLYGNGNPPTFVYFIYVSIFIFFMSFAVNMWLQYRGKGKWADYLYGEKVYMVLSLVAKSALAWQVFAGTLR